MLYLITYLTHDLQYSTILKQSYPNLIVLGYGKKWNGFYDKVKATIDFCKYKNEEDIILFIDGFYSVVIHTDDIIEKYKSFNVPLVFSIDVKPSYIFLKYHQDSYFNTCQSLNLNSGLYIGTAKSIIEFWKDNPPSANTDDQIYATKRCNELNDNIIKIDSENKLFYNYSNMDKDKILVINNKVKINDQYPNIISSPGRRDNMNHILIKLNYDISNIKMKPINFNLFNFFIKYTLQFLFIFFILLIIYFLPNNIKKLQIILILIFIFLHYSLYLKHVNVNITYKILYILIDIIYMYLMFFITYLIFNNKCDKKKLLLLNTIYFIIVLLFYIFKKCIFEVIKKYILGKNKSISNLTKLKYLFDINQKYQKTNNIQYWMENNQLTLLFIVILNLYCRFI